MSDCCTPSCCGSRAADEYPYGSQPFVIGSLPTPAGAVPVVSTSTTRADRFGSLRVRLGFGRSDYRVRPGLYAVGAPDETSPVLVTANYKLSFDQLRSTLGCRNAWLLVLDTRGVNVWCAAGKGTFGTKELCRRIQETGLRGLVSHSTVVLPQLGAPGVAAHHVRAVTGFSVVYGPVRADDLPAFLDAGMRAVPEMRRVRFGVRERFAVTGVELAVVRHPAVLAGAALLVLGASLDLLGWGPVMLAFAAGLTALLSGALVVPLALPWIPGRSFALKGGLVGGIGAVTIVWLASLNGFALNAAGFAGVVLGVTAGASFAAMNFTGSSTFTSPSGVLREMRRAIPLQLAAAIAALFALVASIVWR